MARQETTVPQSALNHEIKTEFHAYFETMFAHELSKQIGYFNSVNKISTAILELLKANRNDLEKVLSTAEHIKHVENELFSATIHGHLLLPDGVDRTPEAVLDLMVGTLSNKNSELPKVMQLHGFFIYRLFDHCTDKLNSDDKATWKKRIFENELFSTRGRTKVDSPIESKVPGTMHNPVLGKLSNVEVKTTGSPKSKFKLDENFEFNRSIRANAFPLACSVSGHTGSLILGAKLYGALESEELREYLIATFSFLTMARAHTFHEVMVLGEKVGLHYSPNDYRSNIPVRIQKDILSKSKMGFFPQCLRDLEGGCEDLSSINLVHDKK